jgi:hypothetical protein
LTLEAVEGRGLAIPHLFRNDDTITLVGSVNPCQGSNERNAVSSLIAANTILDFGNSTRTNVVRHIYHILQYQWAQLAIVVQCVLACQFDQKRIFVPESHQKYSELQTEEIFKNIKERKKEAQRTNLRPTKLGGKPESGSSLYDDSRNLAAPASRQSYS